MGQPQSTGYLGLGNAIANGDLAEVKMWVEKKGLRVNGPPDCDFWDLPLTTCLLQANGKCKHIARYLAGRGAENYDVAAAVEVGDIERVQKLLKGPTPLEKLDRETAGQLLARCTFSGSMDVARYLYHFMGPEKGNDMPGILGTCQDEAYNIRIACCVGDLNRIKKIAVSEHFSINQGFLVRTGNKVHDTKRPKHLKNYTGPSGQDGIELASAMVWAVSSGRNTKVTDTMVGQRHKRLRQHGDVI